MALTAIYMNDEELLMDWRLEENLDHLFTFERDGERYQRRLGDCDVEHIHALVEAHHAFVEVFKADADVLEAEINRKRA
jgi:hypothetical protein